jgi:putative endonuclease
VWYVYLLDCADGDIYKGTAKDVTARIQEHTKGRVEATKHKLPVELICFIAFPNNAVAFRFEKYLTSGIERIKILS